MMGSLGYMPSNGIVSYGSFIPNFLRALHPVSKSLYQPTVSPTMQECSVFPTPSPEFIVCKFFGDGHSDPCEVTSRCSFDLHFSNNDQC